MTIKAVFRVQCDGPCKGWLAETGEAHGALRVVEVALFPGERSARTAALNNGWVRGRIGVKDRYGWMCPTCQLSPPDIRIPKAAPCLGTHDTWAVCKECA